jgi:hypothetical protein
MFAVPNSEATTSRNRVSSQLLSLIAGPGMATMSGIIRMPQMSDPTLAERASLLN